MIVRRELTYACDVDVRQMDLSTNRGWGQFRQAGPDHFWRVPKCVERGNGGVRLEDVHFRRGNDLFSDEDNCDARIKNRIRSSNSRARSGNDRVGMINDCGGRGNYLEIPPVFGPLTLRRLTTVLWEHPQRVFAVYTAQFLWCESHLLQGRGDVGAVAEWIVCTKHNLRGAHEHF